jgi:hypothetical protein
MTQRTYGWPGSGPTDFRGGVNVAEGDFSVEDGAISVKKGDLSLDGGAAFTTTLQCIPATANRTLSLPDANGVLTVLAGNPGQVIYNNLGSYAGIANSVVNSSGLIDLGSNSVASAPLATLSGVWFTGGTATTTKPHLLVEPAGTTSTGWSTTGTGIGVNATAAFTGRLIDLQLNGSTRFSVSSAGLATCRGVDIADGFNISTGTTTGTRIGTATTQRLGFFNATPVVQPAAVTDLTVTATTGTLPTANGSVTVANAATPTTAELLEYCVEIEAKLEAALGRLRSLGLIAT